MGDRLAAILSWLLFYALVLAALLSFSLLADMALIKKAAGQPDCRQFLEETVKPRESGGDYTAANLSASERHIRWGTTGSFGAYQIAAPLWDEEAERQGLHGWAGWYPHWAPPEIQDRIALGLCERYGKCPWLLGEERRLCWKQM